jgi:L,D-peptidoglycan transpeptidase YkuD (ErfK/YbiS/YcfS/YnhG family)
VSPDLHVGRWGARFGGRRMPCAVGRGGIGVKRAEGDGVTPAGRHRIEMVLWRPDRGARPRIRARPIGAGDLWSDDPADPAYNTLVRRPHAFSHEVLRRADRQYDLVAVLDWNRGPAVPGRGSAIFLHLWRGARRPTAGCIALRRRDLAFLLRHWTRRSRVVVRG